jgi:uncharacterized protein YceH (UPF0502 family)
MDEVPGLQRPPLALDQQQALAGEDEKVLLLVLAVVQAGRLPGLEHRNVDPELREAGLALEARERAEVAFCPARVARVQDEPALALRDEACVGSLELRLRHHARSLASLIVAASMDADAVEIRVLGCLIEKQRTTPDVYPLSLNALRLACNQATNRDPVVDFDEPAIRAALDRLSRKGWTRLASGPGSRVAKYRHLLDEALDLVPSQSAVLAVLMLRGAQTPGELKGRTERLYPFGSLEDVQRTLDGLIERELVARLPRRPGQKEERFVQLLGGESEPVETPRPPQAFTPAGPGLEERVSRLEEQVAALQRAVGHS